ncbi:MAG: TlpA family protein disulfide reductase [Clostridia bacterium]|nr:TlpA family protein disulfide reductase [Clostridia bacterium]
MKKAFVILLSFILLLSAVSASCAEKTYQTGSLILDFSIETHDGKTFNLFETLKEKELVVINIWASWCGPCRSEFPHMQEVYEEYSDRIEIIAVSCEPSDTERAIGEFAKELGLTFPIGRDTANLAYLFEASSIPTTAIVNKSGKIELIMAGAMRSAEDFKTLLDAFLMKKPTIAPSGREELSAALNADGGAIDFKNSTDEHAWPMTVGEKDGRSVVQATNTGYPNSYASLKGTVSANAGDVLMVTFKTSTEPMLDLMKICIDNNVIKVFGGEHDWMTYAHPFETTGSHEIEITYVKNIQESQGEDCVWIDSVQVIGAEGAVQALSMNPDFPVHDDLTLLPASENARKVLIFDPLGTLEYYFGEMETFIANDTSCEVTFGLTADIDPEIAFILCDSTNIPHPISTLTPDNSGFYSLNFPLDDMQETGYPYTTVYLFSDPALEPVRTIMLFRDEENLGAMMELLTEDEENPPVWTYEEDLEQQAANGEITQAAYIIRIADTNGNPVPGAMVQVCSDTLCNVYFSDENGQCAFVLEPGSWEMHLLMIPEGYSGDTESVMELSPYGEEIDIVLQKN